MKNKKTVIIFLIIEILTTKILFVFDNFSRKHSDEIEKKQISQDTDLTENNEADGQKEQQNSETKQDKEEMFTMQN